MIGGACAFSVMSLLVKVVGQSLPSQEIVLVRGVVTLTMSYVAVRMAGIHFAGERRGLLVLRGVLGFMAVSCYFYAVIHLPLADATVVHYTNPVFTAILAAVVLSEPIRGRDAASLGLSLAGVILIARPTFLFGALHGALDPLAVTVALIGAAISAGAYVCVRKLRHTDHHLIIVLWFGVVTTLGSIPGAAMDFRLPTGWVWAALIGIGIATHFAQVWMTRGLALEPAGRAMTVGYVQIVFAAIWGALFFGERPTAWTIAGALLIIGSTLTLGRPPRARAT